MCAEFLFVQMYLTSDFFLIYFKTLDYKKQNAGLSP